MWKRSPGLVRRMRGRRKERGAGKLRRLFHQADQGGCILRHADHLDLVALDPQFRHIGGVGQCARDRLQHHDARRRRLLALREQAQADAGLRSTPSRSAARRCEIRRCSSSSSRLQGAAEIGVDQQRRGGGNTRREQDSRSRRGKLTAGPITLRNGWSEQRDRRRRSRRSPARRPQWMPHQPVSANCTRRD